MKSRCTIIVGKRRTPCATIRAMNICYRCTLPAEAGGKFSVSHAGFTLGALGMDIYRFG